GGLGNGFDVAAQHGCLVEMQYERIPRARLEAGTGHRRNVHTGANVSQRLGKLDSNVVDAPERTVAAAPNNQRSIGFCGVTDAAAVNYPAGGEAAGLIRAASHDAEYGIQAPLRIRRSGGFGDP